MFVMTVETKVRFEADIRDDVTAEQLKEALEEEVTDRLKELFWEDEVVRNLSINVEASVLEGGE